MCERRVRIASTAARTRGRASKFVFRGVCAGSQSRDDATRSALGERPSIEPADERSGDASQQRHQGCGQADAMLLTHGQASAREAGRRDKVHSNRSKGENDL
jgi:hypothetical protein